MATYSYNPAAVPSGDAPYPGGYVVPPPQYAYSTPLPPAAGSSVNALASPQQSSGGASCAAKALTIVAIVCAVLLLGGTVALLLLPPRSRARHGAGCGCASCGVMRAAAPSSPSSPSSPPKPTPPPLPSRTPTKVWKPRPRGGDRYQELTPEEADAVLGGVASPSMPAVLLVHSPHCGHCVHFKPVFIEAANASGIHWGMLDGSKAPAVLGAHRIVGVPAVFGVRADGRVVKYSGARTKDALLAFATALVANTAT